MRFFPFLACSFLLALSAQADAARLSELEIAGIRFKAEIASDPESQKKGLMFRKNLPANQGMLFVFPAESRICMWMKNTYVPLSAAFLDSKGRILDIQDMQPQTYDIHCSPNAKYVLEMNQGWFKKNKIKKGALLKGVK